ncbi:restriction endonuclease subunit S [Bacteroides uniformis]|uniref:restriction endonuclease subunit S n=1 Tax=Bacteroides uniformis TaxID=820 RepID=UPI003567A3E6
MDTKKLRQKILDLAIHGKLVPQDPNDEPASVLLERIKAEKERLIKEGKIKKSKKSTKASDTPHYENVPFEVPSSWVWTTLGEISNYGECNNVSVDSITDDDWVLELEDLEKDTAKIIQTLSRSKRSIKGVRHRFNKGDILYSKLRTYLNKVLVAPQSGYCTTEIMPFNSYCNVSSYYLNHVLRSAYFLDYTQQCGYGVKMPRLSTTDACNGMIPLPPLAEQKRIVKEIEHWFSLIDVIESGKEDLQATIKQAKSKILDLAIHGKLVPQDPNDEPASELLKRINSKAEITCDNGHYTFDVPSGWITTNLGSIFNVVSAKRILKSDWKHSGVPFYRAREIAKLSIYGLVDNELYISEEHYNSLKEKFPVPKASDIMISAVGTIGKCYIVKESDKFYYKDASVLCLCNDYQINAKYIYHIMRSEYMLKQMYDNSKGTTVDTITIEKAKQYILPLPPLAEQQRIVAKIEETFSIFDGIQNSLEA